MKKKVLFLILFSAFIMQGLIAQKTKKINKVVITGFVKDVNDQPIKGAVIAVPNQIFTKQTNKKGFFKIKVKTDTKKILVLTPLNGYQEVMYKGSSKMNFVMQSVSDSEFLPTQEKQRNKMLISQGYHEDVIYRNSSEAVIYNSRRINPHKYSSFSQMMGKEMRSSNYVVSPFGLYILDGESFFGVRHLNHLKPTEIKSIKILDMQTAAFGYGMRGMLGVCVVETKLAKEESDNL
jgi:hypothetical protein